MRTLNITKPVTGEKKDIYYEGPFWVIAPSLVDIRRGNFELEGLKIPCDYEGHILSDEVSRKGQVHKRYWKDVLQEKYPGKEYNYYPRGRVGIFEANGIAYIFINSQFNNPFVIDKVVEEYGLENLELEIEPNDVEQGGHYGFQLK